MAELPHGDSAERCRVMLALAVMLYYEPSAQAEVRALAEEGVAMARRLGDPALLAWAALTAWKALWTPAYARPPARPRARGSPRHPGGSATRMPRPSRRSC